MKNDSREVSSQTEKRSHSGSVDDATLDVTKLIEGLSCRPSGGASSPPQKSPNDNAGTTTCQPSPRSQVSAHSSRELGSGLPSPASSNNLKKQSGDKWLDLPKPRPSLPRILVLGGPILYQRQLYLRLCRRYQMILPTRAECQRERFIRALRGTRWGDFVAIWRPNPDSGGDMGPWDEGLISCLPKSVKVFSTASPGQVIDRQALIRRGIRYYDSGDIFVESVSDVAVALIISTFRFISLSLTSVLSRLPINFKCGRILGEMCNTMRGKILGIIGLGRVGQAIARRCLFGFGMRIHYFDKERKSRPLEQTLGASFHASINSLFGTADCVVLCASAKYGGSPIITGEAWRQLRVPGRFVSVAHGSLIDQAEMITALKSRILLTVGMDLIDDEPSIPQMLKHYVRRGRVLLTWHNGTTTREARTEVEGLTMFNMLRGLAYAQGILAPHMTRPSAPSQR